MLASQGSSMRRSNIRERSAPRPEASMIAFARTARGAAPLVTSWMVTVTPSSSKVTFRTRCCSWTSAPLAAACRSRRSSKVARGTCHVWGARTSGAMAKSAYRSMRPSPVMKVAPHFCGKPACRTKSAAPIAARTSFTDASSDSPMWKRGNRSRSKRMTRRPLRASQADAAEPAGPPPATTTSQSNDMGAVVWHRRRPRSRYGRSRTVSRKSTFANGVPSPMGRTSASSPSRSKHSIHSILVRK